MKKLLQIEWMKIKGYTAFILLTSFYALGVLATNYIVFAFKKNVLDKVQGTQILFGGSPFAFDMVWQTVSYYSSFFLMLPALLIVILITNEFTFRTHRQNVIDGWSRWDFLKVKMGLAVILAIASTLVVIIIALLFGFLSGSSFSVNGIDNLGYFFLKALSYNMVGILVALICKRSGVAIAVFFIYTILENGISMLLFFLSIKLKKENDIDLGNLGNYLPMNSSDGLLTSPLDKFTGIAKHFLPTDYNWVVFGFAFAYLVLFFWWSRRKMLHDDL